MHDLSRTLQWTTFLDQLRVLTINSLFQLFAKAADVDGEVNEITKKKHVTLDDRPRSEAPKSGSNVVDLKSRYWLPPHLFTICLTSLPLLATQSRPLPLPYRPSSAGPSIRHSSLRNLTMLNMSDISLAKKRFTPPPSMSKSMVNNSSISGLNYGNHFRENYSNQVITDKVILLLFPFL